MYPRSQIQYGGIKNLLEIHACRDPHPANQANIFSEHKVFKVVVMATQHFFIVIFFKKIVKIMKSSVLIRKY